MEDDLKISKGEYLSNHCMDQTSEENSEKNSEEISSVALLSPACYYAIIRSNTDNIIIFPKNIDVIQ